MKYRRKPVVIEAIQYTGNNMLDLISFTERKASFINESDRLIIYTLEGSIIADSGDYIVKSINGGFYPCKPDIFEASYREDMTGSESGISMAKASENGWEN